MRGQFESGEDVPFSLLMPAFVTSELKTAFQIGFLLLIPFLVIDLVIASLLMSMGIPYDSDAGRGICGALTALLTGQAYLTSSRMAGYVGPFDGYQKNEQPMLRVMRKHRRAVDDGYLVKQQSDQDRREAIVVPSDRLEKLMIEHFERTLDITADTLRDLIPR